MTEPQAVKGISRGKVMMDKALDVQFIAKVHFKRLGNGRECTTPTWLIRYHLH